MKLTTEEVREIFDGNHTDWERVECTVRQHETREAIFKHKQTHELYKIVVETIWNEEEEKECKNGTGTRRSL